MLIIRSQHLKPNEKKLLKRFCAYVMDHFCTQTAQSKAVVLVRFIDGRGLPKDEREELVRYRAWMTYEGIKGGRKHFTIDIAATEVSGCRRTKSLIKRLRNAMLCLGHELTHVKQYMNGEVFDYANGDVRYKGERYTDWQQGEEYYFSPWEVESYGREIGLYKCFAMKLKESTR